MSEHIEDTVRYGVNDAGQPTRTVIKRDKRERILPRCVRCNTTLGLAQVPDAEWVCAPCACNDIANLRLQIQGLLDNPTDIHRSSV